MYLRVLVAQSCPTLCNCMDCSPSGSSVHGILQARILEWIAISFYRGSSQPRDWTWVSCVAGRFFTFWATREGTIDNHKYFFLRWEPLRSCPLSNFHMCSAAPLTLSLRCITLSVLNHLKTGSLCLLTRFIHFAHSSPKFCLTAVCALWPTFPCFPYLPVPGKHLSILCFYEFNFFFPFLRFHI